MFGRKPTKKRRNGFLEILNGMLSLLVLGIVVALGVFLFALNRFYATSDVAEGATFRVEQGAGLGSTAERLEEAGLIENRFVFQAGGMALRKQRDLKPGLFSIPAGASMAEVLEQLTEGDAIEVAITVPEGFTTWQVVDRLNKEPNLVGEIAALPAEGTILPQTYRFTPGTTREDALKQMQADQKAVVAEIWANRDPDLPISTPEELITLASVVEKETGVPSERPQVAAVFVNRLRQGMRLQSDPTIIYGITMGRTVLGRGLTRSEIEAETPYNTYQVDGLPAGPIANPGVDALRATANPADTDDLYFVAAGADPSEGHLFAETYEEHRQNVAKYRQIEQQAAETEDAETAAAKDAIEAAEAGEGEEAAEPAQ